METSGNEPAQGEITGCSSPSWDLSHVTTSNWKNTAFHVGRGLGFSLRGPQPQLLRSLLSPMGAVYVGDTSFLSQSTPCSPDLKV